MGRAVMQGVARGARQGAADGLPFGASFRPRPEGRTYGAVQRVTYGLGWAVMTVIFLAAGLYGITSGTWVAMLGIPIGIGSAYYDYQIWTYRARRLWKIR